MTACSQHAGHFNTAVHLKCCAAWRSRCGHVRLSGVLLNSCDAAERTRKYPGRRLVAGASAIMHRDLMVPKVPLRPPASQDSCVSNEMADERTKPSEGAVQPPVPSHYH